jgi:hypothetical protein
MTAKRKKNIKDCQSPAAGLAADGNRSEVDGTVCTANGNSTESHEVKE